MFPQYIFRFIFILLLLGSSFSASLFMVLESAEFYREFYSPENPIDFGLWAAILNEVFLVVMSAVWLPKIDTGKKKHFHPGNLLIKLLMLFLFINTVGGASLNVISDNLDKLQQEQNRIATLESLKKQLEENRSSMEAFVQQNQRLNTAITARNLTDINKELRDLQLSQKSTFALWLDILMLFILRFTIQLGNITSVWLASWLFRQPITSAGIFHTSTAGALRNDLKSSFEFAEPTPPSPQAMSSDELNRGNPMLQQIQPNSPPAEQIESESPETSITPKIPETPGTPPKTERFSEEKHSATVPAPEETPAPIEKPATSKTPIAMAPSALTPTSHQKHRQNMPPAETPLPTKTASNIKKPAPFVPKKQKPVPPSEIKAEVLDDADVLEADSELIQLADEVRDMWQTTSSRISVKEFCNSLGLNLSLFNRIIQDELTGISVRDMQRMHRQIKERFEADQIY